MRIHYVIAYVGGVLVIAVLVVLLGLLFQQRTLVDTSEHKVEVPVIRDNDEFSQIEASPQAVVKFHAQWCPSCRATEEVFARVAYRLKGKVDFFVVDVTDQQRVHDIVKRYEIVGVPVFMCLKHGNEVLKEKRMLGEVEEQQLYEGIVNAFKIDQRSL